MLLNVNKNQDKIDNDLLFLYNIDSALYSQISEL